MPSTKAKNRKMEKKKLAETNKRLKKDRQRQRKEIKKQNEARGKHLEAYSEFLSKVNTIENDSLKAALVELENTIEELGEIPTVPGPQTMVRGRFR